MLTPSYPRVMLYDTKGAELKHKYTLPLGRTATCVSGAKPT